MPGPTVSAIIATYNRGYIIREAIESILAQTYTDREIIVVDDGSTDDTPEILSRYGKEIRVVRQDNGGPAKAWNHGIEAANGEVIAFLGSDDLWLPTFLERQISVLERLGPAVPCCLTNGLLKLAHGKETSSFALAGLTPRSGEGIWHNVMDVLNTRFVMCGQLLAVRSNVLKKIGCFDPHLRYLEDYDLALRLSIEGPWGFIRDPLVIYRQSANDSLSIEALDNAERLTSDLLMIRQRFFKALEMCPEVPGRMHFLRHAIKKAERDLWASRLESRKASRATVGLYRWLEHWRLALLERSPWYPRMVSTAVLHSEPTP